jgi:HlyD family secretion protein
LTRDQSKTKKLNEVWTLQQPFDILPTLTGVSMSIIGLKTKTMAQDDKFGWGKWLLLLVVIGALGGGGVWYFKFRKEDPPEYQTATATRGSLTQVVTATGQLGPVLSVQVGSQISGIVKKLYADFNSTVKSNQIVAEIDSSTYLNSVRKAEAGLANSQANLALSQAQARRAQGLHESRLISDSEYDITVAQLQQAKAQVQSDEASVESAKVQLSYCTIYAPVDGVVVARNVDVGQTVAASFNTPQVFLIANDLTKMQIDALVSEADIGGVATNQDVVFNVDAYPYRTFRGKVGQIRVGAITNQSVINYDCVIKVDNDDLKLLPGMTANVQIITAERSDVLKIPNGALRFRPPDVVAAEGKTNPAPRMIAQGNGDAGGRGGARQGGGGGGGGGRRGGAGGDASTGGARPRPERQVNRTVYVLPAKNETSPAETLRLKPVPIKVGISDGMWTEVTEGLEEGVQVVTGVIQAESPRPGAPAANPFGGGMRRF